MQRPSEHNMPWCVQPLDEGCDAVKLPHFRIHNDVAHSIDHGHSLFSDALERLSSASGTRSFVQPSIPTMTAMAQESPSPKAMREQQIQDVKKGRREVLALDVKFPERPPVA